mmetsp:Transcript_220/g.487  ORF Transcript_220/g.487 Transcript_220/m.487 type:complete len:680 (-) Transcript_220:158-2197(-)|eukprot:CAMPEP_0171079318 /NCGR_PEP_ID=MMETSP0766_2-20121228/15181_1 /TAXON_ID=439317 /ORGANISM="Gambierdiscus australes, Strain CAWD 149" /LENGTH=679 /DNA_ID=CAMNT_0011536499 /DNA_START=29 /DNA_END=2068 /DNA_ORIENTATION=+
MAPHSKWHEACCSERSERQEENSRFVIREASLFKRFWDFVVVAMLIYVATVMPYHLCFIDLAIPKPLEKGSAWEVLETVFEILFVIDLVLGFFFAYSDENGTEVRSLRRIVWRYVKGHFFINLIASLPMEVLKPVINSIFANQEVGVNKALRLARLERVSRISRLVRLTRLTKLVSIVKTNPHWLYLQSLRGVRVVNFLSFLCLTVHLGACGWYLVASLHKYPETTWVERRGLIEKRQGVLHAVEPPGVQWLTACYFILTLITTVGFGDMSAITTWEILYVLFAMLGGSLVNSLILSEVITVLQSVDRKARAVEDQQRLCEAFSDHAHLNFDLSNALKAWATKAHQAHRPFDGEGMKNLLINNAIPLNLMGQMPADLFDGQLMKNRFITVCRGPLRRTLPPRFSLLVAVALHERWFACGEFVYNFQDYAFNLFLVMKGVFANVAKATPDGGFANIVPTAAWDSPLPASRSNSRAAAVVHDPPMKKVERLSPYQVFAPSAYFGDAEILVDLHFPRKSGVRCETANGGMVLVLHKDDLFSLVADFPVYAIEWQHHALRREAMRQRLLTELTEDVDYRSLSACTIQRFVRERQAVRRGAASREGKTLQTPQSPQHQVTKSSTKTLPSRFLPKYAQHLREDIAEVSTDVVDLKNHMREEVDKLNKIVADIKSNLKGLSRLVKV